MIKEIGIIYLCIIYYFRAQEQQKGLHSGKEQPIVRIVDASEVKLYIYYISLLYNIYI